MTGISGSGTSANTGNQTTYVSGNNIYVTANSSGQTYSWSAYTSPYPTSSTAIGVWNNTFDTGVTESKNIDIVINEGQEMTITMPNGAILTVNEDGSYEMVDDGKIIYKGCKVREFNRFINASDLLEEFIIFMGQKFNVRQGEILQIPIELFINWLIIRTCQEDGDDIPQDVLKIEDHSYVKKTKIIPRCRYCGRFIPRKYSDNSVLFCNSRCTDKKIQNILES